jgi:outer membrane lipoprotein-sorting protein
VKLCKELGEVVNLKKILLLAFFLFILTLTNTFAQTDPTRVLEISDDFTEIMAAFQKRLYAASAEFKYFLHNDGPFDIENGYESQLFDAKAMEAIGNNKYFIFETTDTMTGSTAAGIYMYLLILVNKDDAEAISFVFINDWVRHKNITPSSKAEIKRALALYPDLYVIKEF